MGGRSCALLSHLLWLLRRSPSRRVHPARKAQRASKALPVHKVQKANRALRGRKEQRASRGFRVRRDLKVRRANKARLVPLGWQARLVPLGWQVRRALRDQAACARLSGTGATPAPSATSNAAQAKSWFR